MDNNQFARLCKEKDIENFYKIMLSEKKIISKRDEEEFEAGYFAMCLLIPKDSFLKMIDALGGIEFVKSNYEAKECLARAFFVERRLIEIRINDLLLQEKEESKTKKLKK